MRKLIAILALAVAILAAGAWAMNRSAEQVGFRGHGATASW